MTDKKGVSILITGGNIGLFATKDSFNNDVLEPVKIEKIKEIIIGDPKANTIVLRENTIHGVRVPLKFTDLRTSDKRKFYDPEELDSAQVDPEVWASIANTIKEDYENYEGFVILHGLDTLAYTASALSFMLLNLHAPVILTGSQRPLNFPRTDATQNIYSAITLAASKSLGINPVISEVTAYSYDTLYRGNRVSMSNATSYRAFDSPNFPHLCTVGEHIAFQTHLIKKPSTATQLQVKTDASEKVVILDVFPGMDSSIIRSLSKRGSKIKGVLLRTYGMGTAPTSQSVLNALDALSNNQAVIMNVTQARSGRISHGNDPVSLRLFEQGVISGVDMTSEAAYAKLVIYLSANKDTEEVSDLLQIEEVGEQSISIFNVHYDSDQTDYREDSGDTANAVLKHKREITNKHLLKHKLIKNIQLRLLGVEPLGKEDGKRTTETIEVSINLVDPEDEERKIKEELKTDILRWSIKGRSTINIAYDITDAKDKLLSLDGKISSLLMIESGKPIRWKRLHFVIFANTERSS